MVDKTRVYNWYISLVAASCMVLYGYDASVFNALQNSKHWIAYYNNPGPNIIGAINTSYTVGAVVAGFFMVRHVCISSVRKTCTKFALYRLDRSLISLAVELVWLLDLYASSSRPSCKHSPPADKSVSSLLVVSSSVSDKVSH